MERIFCYPKINDDRLDEFMEFMDLSSFKEVLKIVTSLKSNDKNDIENFCTKVNKPVFKDEKIDMYGYNAFIYFLFNEGEFVYIGQSINPNRIAQHIYGKKFDECYVMYFNYKEYALFSERYVLGEIETQYNRCHSSINGKRNRIVKKIYNVSKHFSKTYLSAEYLIQSILFVALHLIEKYKIKGVEIKKDGCQTSITFDNSLLKNIKPITDGQ